MVPTHLMVTVVAWLFGAGLTVGTCRDVLAEEVAGSQVMGSAAAGLGEAEVFWGELANPLALVYVTKWEGTVEVAGTSMCPSLSGEIKCQHLEKTKATQSCRCTAGLLAIQL